MKITISLNDEILREADETACRMGLSRSRLFALAVADFLERHRQPQKREPVDKSLLKGMKAKTVRTVTEPW
jgi:metal-responsive CopG/Arc/MetJ family transcriptional regulator